MNCSRLETGGEAIPKYARPRTSRLGREERRRHRLLAAAQAFRVSIATCRASGVCGVPPTARDRVADRNGETSGKRRRPAKLAALTNRAAGGLRAAGVSSGS
ncbi:hypothetical protein GCM10010840_04830 [Deinococcus aerolatus]|uniref:Uncharacterized protein n=1 Tax=Deinococcus aerolatus TaxID=522487 RepID=A0ABQ2G117_9DEIO|nr:hypothetical protein GCM10010840_04830 [Deinococcus aerolatus]